MAATKEDVRFEWFIQNVSSKIAISMRGRILLAAEHLKTKVVKNISRPVSKAGGSITNRSVKGEFPKADTTLLMKTIFAVVVSPSKGIWDGLVGTPLEYGLFLEVSLDRSFLLKTLKAEMPRLKRIMTGPMKL